VRDEATRWLADIFQDENATGDITLEVLVDTFTLIRNRLEQFGADTRTIEGWAATYMNVADRDWPNHPLGSTLRVAVEQGFRVTLRQDEAGRWHASIRQVS
jgi:hypothetical protein